MKKLILLLVSVGCSSQLFGATLYVSPSGSHTPPFSDWATAAYDIQSAVDASDDGDVVMVGDGFYDSGTTSVSNLPNRVSVTKSIIVQSVNGPESTLIVGAGPVGPSAVRCVYLSSGARLSGFTLTNGHTHVTGTEEWDSIGGGALLLGGVVTDCIIVSNSAYQGGGINVHQSGVVSNCIVRSNSADFTGGGIRIHKGGRVDNCSINLNFADYGGGVDINQIGIFSNCDIDSNTAGVRGGGVWCYFGGNLTNSTITANSAVHGGGGVFCASGGTLVNCIISSNINSLATTWLGGGGVYCSRGGILKGCVIDGNSASMGGGADCADGGSFNNCTLSGNSALSSGGGARFFSGGALTNCIAWGNIAPGQGSDILYDPVAIMYSSCSPDLIHGVDGHITNAPLFIDPENGDYRLLATSPCIDSGDNDADATSTDLDGNPRIVDGDLDGTATVDMGAYEFQIISVELDVKPGSRTNPINLGSRGRTLVAILSTGDFDARTVNHSSVRVAGASPIFAIIWDADWDGDKDMILMFKTADFQITEESTMMALIGQTNDGRLLVGEDSIKVVPKRKRVWRSWWRKGCDD